MTSEAVVSLFTASLAATERALAEESAKARQAESALATATTRIHKLEMELLLARAESAQWRNRYALECERRVWENKNHELQRGLAAQQSAASNDPSTSHTPDPVQKEEESEEAQAPQEPSPPDTPVKPNDPTPPAIVTVQEPLTAASPTVEPVPSPPAPATPSSHHDMSRPEEPRPESATTSSSSALDVAPIAPCPVSSPPPSTSPQFSSPAEPPQLSRTIALPRVEHIGPMAVKVYIEQERYRKFSSYFNLVGRIFGPACSTLRSVEAATGCSLKVFCHNDKMHRCHGPPYVLVKLEGPVSQAGARRVEAAARRVQGILTPPPDGFDALWQQQHQTMQESKKASQQQLNGQAPPAFAQIPLISAQSAPCFDTRSESRPQQQLQPKKKQSTPRQQPQSGQKEPLIGIWRL